MAHSYLVCTFHNARVEQFSYGKLVLFPRHVFFGLLCLHVVLSTIHPPCVVPESYQMPVEQKSYIILLQTKQICGFVLKGDSVLI